MVENITPQLETFLASRAATVCWCARWKRVVAEKRPFRAGDVVVKVNDQPVHDTSDLRMPAFIIGRRGGCDRYAREERAESDSDSSEKSDSGVAGR
jgi:hypothetical protein